MAFQIIDDILDVTASSEVLGKTAGKDLTADKTTYPKLLGLEESKARAEALVQEACSVLKPWSERPSRCWPWRDTSPPAIDESAICPAAR